MPFNRLVSLFCIFSASLVAAGTAVAAEPVRMTFAGSGSNLYITRLLIEAFQKKNPQYRIDVPPSIGSPGGIRAAADGAIDMGLVSRALKESEAGLGLILVPYARTGVVFAVHPSVPEEGLATEDVFNIYRGKKTRWKNGSEIIVLTREPDDSSIAILVQGIPGFKEIYDESQRTRRWTTVLTDQEMNRLIGQTPHAIGLSDNGAISTAKLPIKALAFNGVAPNPKNIRSGKYNLYKPLGFVYRKDRLSAGVKSFIAFVKSPEGEKILMQNGYIPSE